MNIKPIVLIPMSPTLPEPLKRVCQRQANDLFAHTGWPVTVDSRGIGDGHILTLEERVAHTCAVKNAMLEELVIGKGYTHVFWLDADLLYSPVEMRRFAANWMLMANGPFVAAPGVYLQGEYPRWYDTAGFVLRGQYAKLQPPYFEEKQGQQVVELEGVGCAYIVPSAVYETGGRHEPVAGFTDHLHICRLARSRGMRVVCDLHHAVYHAFLPDFGRPLH